jgi:hypothetical protein
MSRTHYSTLLYSFDTLSGSDDLLILRRKHGLIVTFERIGLMFVETQRSEFYQMFEENINNREDCAITFV